MTMKQTTDMPSRPLRSAALAASVILMLIFLAGCGKGNSIVGKWSGTLPASQGQSAQWNVEFKPDGTEAQTIAVVGKSIDLQAKYTAQDGVLTQTLVGGTMNGQKTPGGRTDTLNYKVDGDTLSLSKGDFSDTSSILVLRRQKG